MRTILNLFGRSPFVPLRNHMEKVSFSVLLLKELLESFLDGNYEGMRAIAEKIQASEHEADLVKNDIRNHLPKTLFLPIDRSQLLEILALQDRLADTSKDVAILCLVKEMTLPNELKLPFLEFANKNLEAFGHLLKINQEMYELLESSFGGFEATKVSHYVEEVARAEREADVLQRQLLIQFFATENKFTFGNFYLWQKITEALSGISNISESLANRVRMTLELA